jgi:SAM-dependent methyltransferase
MALVSKLSEWLYPGWESMGISPIDGTLQFYSKVNHLLKPNSVILDYGAGRGAQFECDPWTQHLLLLHPKCSVRMGCDVDPVVLDNPFIDKAFILHKDANYEIPTDSESVDLVLADWVLEHLPDPLNTFKDVYRVLKKGGWFCARTGNLLHYSYATAHMIGDSIIGNRILSKSQPHRQDKDVFPKHFRANLSWQLRNYARETGFRLTHIHQWEPEPGYLKFNSLSLLVGAIYQRIASVGLAPKATLLLYCQK